MNEHRESGKTIVYIDESGFAEDMAMLLKENALLENMIGTRRLELMSLGL